MSYGRQGDGDQQPACNNRSAGVVDFMLLPLAGNPRKRICGAVDFVLAVVLAIDVAVMPDKSQRRRTPSPVARVR